MLRKESTQLVLRSKQISHWINLFSCDFDQTYANSAIRIGKAHFKNKVPPHLYIAGYNFFQCQLIVEVSDQLSGEAELPQCLAAIAKVISLDMDLALSAYTRQYWRSVSEATKAAP